MFQKIFALGGAVGGAEIFFIFWGGQMGGADFFNFRGGSGGGRNFLEPPFLGGAA